MSYTRDEIIQTKQTINRLTAELAKARVNKRKQETRRKIELGGLIVKAKMDHLPKSVILGALLSANFEIENDKEAYLNFRKKGEVEFEKSTLK